MKRGDERDEGGAFVARRRGRCVWRQDAEGAGGRSHGEEPGGGEFHASNLAARLGQRREFPPTSPGLHGVAKVAVVDHGDVIVRLQVGTVPRQLPVHFENLAPSPGTALSETAEP